MVRRSLRLKIITTTRLTISKIEFDKVHDKLIQMDKKITEMTVLQKAITGNSGDISEIETRLRLIEVDIARHNAQTSKSPRNNKSPSGS